MQLSIAFCHAACFNTIVLKLLKQMYLRLQSKPFVFPSIFKVFLKLNNMLSKFLHECIFHFYHYSTYGNVAQITISVYPCLFPPAHTRYTSSVITLCHSHYLCLCWTELIQCFLLLFLFDLWSLVCPLSFARGAYVGVWMVRSVQGSLAVMGIKEEKRLGDRRYWRVITDTDRCIQSQTTGLECTLPPSRIYVRGRRHINCTYMLQFVLSAVAYYKVTTLIVPIVNLKKKFNCISSFVWMPMIAVSVRQSVSLSVCHADQHGFTVQKRQNGSQSCLWCLLPGPNIVLDGGPDPPPAMGRES